MAKKRIIKRISKLAASALALAVMVPTANAQDKAQAAKTPQKATASKATLQTELPGLLAHEVTHALSTLEKDATSAKLVKSLSKALANPKTKAKDLEADVLKLIKGKKPEQAQLALDAVMLKYYNDNLAKKSKTKAVSSVVAEMSERDDKLVDAAFGKTDERRTQRKTTHRKRHRM